MIRQNGNLYAIVQVVSPRSERFLTIIPPVKVSSFMKFCVGKNGLGSRPQKKRTLFYHTKILQRTLFYIALEIKKQ